MESYQQGWTISTPAISTARVEPGTIPTYPITQHWETFANAADKAGISRLYASTNFRSCDLAGRKLGRAVAAQSWIRAQTYFPGTASTTGRVRLESESASKITVP